LPACTAFAVAAFTGLRHGEIQGLEWTDLHDDQRWVARSVWNGYENEPKTRKSKAPVPVIKQLAAPRNTPLACWESPECPMFTNSVGGRLNLNNALAREILPGLNRCSRFGVSEGKLHLKQDHDSERDASIPEWRGWLAAVAWLRTSTV
jgi:hypothetical protein